ncbi:MAG: hypothetical protein D6675_10440 [Gemmatimonadetes bacterium]|nr:MAG: hypothetical protein D6675_10440 [Gemmatimonadota bacterium]
MGRLKKIIDAIAAESKGAQAKLIVARVGLKAGVNLSKIDESTPDDPVLEEKLLKAAHAILGKPITIN